MPANTPRRLGLRKPTKPQVDWSHPINRGLVACWPVTPNSSGNPVILDIAGQRHFTTSSGALSDAKFGGTTIKYDGSTKFSSAPAAKDGFANLGALTISFWINHFSAQTGRIFAYGGTSATGGFTCSANSGDGVAFVHGFGTTGLTHTTNNSVLSENVWHHVILTWPGGLTAANCHTYIDTVEPGYGVAVDGVGTTVDDSASILFMGSGNATPTNVLNGALENLRIYNRVISATERLRLFREPWVGIKDRSENIIYHKGGTGGGNVTVAITGNASTTAQGTLGVKNTHALTGNASTASEGSVKGGQPLRGNQVSASEGTLSPKLVVALTGNASTASQGTIKATPTKALTGNQVTTAEGSLGKTLVRALAGNQSTASEGTLTPSTSGNVSVALTGISMIARQGTLTAVAPSTAAVGGHFIPLTEKQIRDLKKRERRDRQARDDIDESRRMDALGIEADIRATLAPAPEPPINSQTFSVESIEDDEADLELLLLHA